MNLVFQIKDSNNILTYFTNPKFIPRMDEFVSFDKIIYKIVVIYTDYNKNAIYCILEQTNRYNV